MVHTALFCPRFIIICYTPIAHITQEYCKHQSFNNYIIHVAGATCHINTISKECYISHQSPLMHILPSLTVLTSDIVD